MPRKLNLRSEHLTELTDSQLDAVAAGQATISLCWREWLDEQLHTKRPTQCWCP